MNEQTQRDLAEDKGTKDDHNKVDFTLLDPCWEEQVARVMMVGLKKYKRGNWQKDLDPSRILAAAERHLNKIKQGEWIDEESGLPHSAHIAANTMFINYYERHGKPVKTEHNKN